MGFRRGAGSGIDFFEGMCQNMLLFKVREL